MYNNEMIDLFIDDFVLTIILRICSFIVGSIVTPRYLKPEWEVGLIGVPDTYKLGL